MKEERVIQLKIKHGHTLSYEEQMAIFDMEEPAKWFRLYVKHYKIYSPEVECKMIELNNYALLNFYFQEYILKGETLNYLFEEKNQEIFDLFLRHNLLTEEDQARLVDLGNIKLLRSYLKNWYFEPSAQYRLIDKADKEMIRTYIAHHKFAPKVELYFVKKNDASLLQYYIKKYNVTSEAKEVLFNIASPSVVQTYTYTWVYPKAWTK